MDTDDLSEMAYRIIVKAAQVCDTLKADLGARSRRYDNEDDWLRGTRDFLRDIVEAPDEYVEYWDLEEEDGIAVSLLSDIATELSLLAEETLARPVDRRNQRG